MFESPVVVPRTPSIVSSVRRYALLALLIFDACVLAAVALTLAVAPKPVATAQLTLDDPRGNSVFRQSNLPAADLASYTEGRASFAHSGPVLSRASALLGGTPTDSYLYDHSAAAVGTNSSVLEIEVTGESESQAVAAANAISAAYQELSAAQTSTDAETALRSLATSRQAALRASTDDPSGQTAAGRSLSTTLAELDSRASEIRLNAALFGDGVSQVQPANVARTGSTGSAVKNIAAGALLGILFGVAAAVALASRQRPLEEPEDAYDILGAPMLGELSRSRHGSASAQYDIVASALTAAMPRGTVAITDCRPGRGATDAGANIALALATGGSRLGLIDAGGGHYQLSNLLGDRVQSAGAPHEFPVADGLVEVGFADPSRGNEVLTVLADMHSRCDLVVVLCPSVEEPGAAQILRASDSAVVLVPAGELSARLTRLRHTLALLDVPVLGYVFTRGDIPFDSGAARAPVTTVQRS